MNDTPRGFKVPLFRVAKKAAHDESGLSSALAIANSRDYAYMAYLSIGGQNMSVILDTGSADLWVVSSDCHDSDCDNVVTYSQTSTFAATNVPFKLKYLLGSVRGSVGFETVALGPYRISSQVFAIANSTLGLGMSSTGNSGILGLAFSSEASITSTIGQPFLKNIASHFPEDQRYFAIKLARDDAISSFTFGELDPLYANSTDEFHWSPVYKSDNSMYDYWKLPLHGISVNDTALTSLSDSKISGSTTPIAVLDSGTTLILGPENDVQFFWESVGGAIKDESGQWQVPCNRGLIVKLLLGSEESAKEYVLDPQDVSWMDGGRQGDLCMGGIQANDGVNSGDWLLGDVFLRSVYAFHQLDTANKAPQIGLLGTTDADQAMAVFLKVRGSDDSAVGIKLAHRVQKKLPPTSSTIYGVSIGAGFVIGALFTLVLLLKGGSSGIRNRAK